MNVSEELGIKAIKYFVGEYPELLHPRFSLDFLVEAVCLVLQNNVSFFDGVYKRQILGCAMGSHKSPPYASLAVGFIEKEANNQFHESKGSDYAEYVKKMLERFLDDVFIKWKMSLGDPQEFFSVLNNVEEGINFTMESGNKIPFLDIHFELEQNGDLHTDIYYKDTDTHNYVPYGSFHPRKTLTNIPYSLARRISVIVSKPNRRDERLAELKGRLLKKKYPVGVVNSAIESARRLDRLAILNPISNSESETPSNNIPFVYTNNCANPDVLNIVRNGLSILAPSEHMTTVMKDKKIIAARRQMRNLKSLLFKSRFDTSDQNSKGSVLPCKKDKNRRQTRGRPCKCCDSIQECTSFLFKNSTEPFELRYHFTCDTRNVLYALTCQGCGENYIGKTERELRERCGEYRTAIQSKKFTQGVHEHIATCGDGQLVITPFLKIHDSSRDSQTILSYETRFIQRYKPRLNVLKL